jgi:PAS domain S-box-containing protein
MLYEQVQKDEQKYQSLMNQSPDCLFVSRTDDLRFTEVNERACDNYGYSREEFLSMSILDVEVNPPTQEEVRALYDKFPIGHVLEVYVTNKRKDGSTFPVHVRFSKIDETHAIANVRDVTQQKMDEDERKREAEQAEQAKIEQATNLARTRELQASRQRMVEAGESVRKEMARQLHGGVQNKLIVLAHQVHHLTTHASSDEMAHHLEGIEQSLKSVIDKDVRQVSRQLYPSVLSSGLVPGLQSLLEGIDQTLGISLNLDQNLILSEREENKLIPESIRLAAYRVIEEAVTNAVKHANASQVQIDVGYEADVSLKISVSDDGQGFDIVKTNLGFGTLLLHDLAETSGGSCSILSEPGKGTHITATFPL